MKTTPSQKVRIGIFTLVGIGLLVTGIFIIGNKKNMFGDTFSIYGKYKNVGGLQIGNNIRFAGINVGTVEDITIENDSTVRVDMRLQSKVRPFLKKDAVASIGSEGLMGDKLITIAPGANGTALLGKGGQIMTIDPTGFDKIVNKFARVAENAEIITNSLASITSQISAGKGSIGKLIYTDSLEQGLVSTVNAAHETMKSVKKGTEGFGENMTAMKHNFLFKGYYKHKAKNEQKKQKKEEREQRKQDKREAKDQQNSDTTKHK
ncbi:MAG: MlaD family protein [Chitinophagales bacterium]